MGLQMPSPYRRPDSGIYWLRYRVPADLVPLLGGKEKKLSLRTRDPAEARSAFLEHMNETKARWQSLRRGMTSLSHNDAVAIAGDFYRQLVSENEDEPGDRCLVLGRLLLDQVAAAHPRAKVMPAGRSEVTERLLDGLKNKSRAAVQRYLDERGERVLPQASSAISPRQRQGGTPGLEREPQPRLRKVQGP